MARILVVDDEEGIRSYLADALDLDGYDVAEAGDGHEAWQRLRREQFHVVLTDLKMPRMDGMTLLERLRAEQPEVEVIVLTAHGSVDTAVDAMKLGAFDYLSKPISGPGELRELVGRAVERHRLRARAEERAEDAPPPLTWGASTMTPVVDALRKVARTDATVLLLGESGSGKEVAARAVHGWSARAAGPFVAVNCASLSDTLLESELFGHERGAFTGAVARRRGRLELAEGGTFFLDEVGELKPDLQAKLLRVLQEKQFERVGGGQAIKADVRWIAATNQKLREMVLDGRFREDLYYRLAVFPVELPPLRDRPEDLLPLARVLLERVALDIGRPELGLPDGARDILGAYSWPGNVRELANALERAAILSDGPTLDPAALVPTLRAEPKRHSNGIRSLEALEKDAIAATLAHVEGNRRKAASILGIGERTLYDKLKRYDIS